MSQYPYILNHIPRHTPNNRRPAYPMSATTITIHNTGNTTSTAANERAWLTNPSNNRTASYHIAIDNREAIECLPLNESAWASGDGSGSNSGNRTSIHIEICESGNYQQTLDNAVHLVAYMLKERAWDVDKLRRHWDWARPSDGYRKICPRLMYDNGKWTGWDSFKHRVQQKLQEDIPMTSDEKQAFEELKTVSKKQEQLIYLLNKDIAELNRSVVTLKQQLSMKEIPDWAKDATAASVNKGLVDTPEGGSYDFYRILTILRRGNII